MDQSIDDVIWARCKEASELDIANKADMIACMLGKKETEKTVWAHFTSYTFKNDNFEIRKESSDDGGDFGCSQAVRVNYRRELVFQGSVHMSTNSLDAYVPGKWMKAFEELYDEANLIYENKQRKSREEAIETDRKFKEDLKKRFGIH